MTKDIIEQESLRLSSGIRNELHLYREGTFLRAYGWSAWLAYRYLHEFKVNKRQFKGIDAPVAYIGFPDTSLAKWLPEGVEQSAVDDKHLQLLLPEQLLPDPLETMQADYERWKESVPLAVNGQKKGNPHRRYVSNRTLHRMRQKILGHYRSYRLRREMFYNLRYVYQYGYYLHGMKKYMLFDSTHSMSSCICELGCQ